MAEDDLLKGKRILAVDDEPDVLDTLEELLPMCHLVKATTADEAMALFESQRFDIAILDIMGVGGFELLEKTTAKGIPTVMLTAHALTPDVLKKSIQLGAVFFLPKETLPELRFFLEELVKNKFIPSWMTFFEKLNIYLNKYFGPNWKEKDQFFREFEESILKSENAKREEYPET